LRAGLNLQDVTRLVHLHEFAFGIPVVKLCNTWQNWCLHHCN